MAFVTKYVSTLNRVGMNRFILEEVQISGTQGCEVCKKRLACRIHVAHGDEVSPHPQGKRPNPAYYLMCDNCYHILVRGGRFLAWKMFTFI